MEAISASTRTQLFLSTKIGNHEVPASSGQSVGNSATTDLCELFHLHRRSSNEDQEGVPFVGRAGALLDKMLASIDLNRKNVYITNVVNYRPPENRRPTEEEIAKYLPYLKKHIEIINPKILVLLGSTALNALIGNEIVISKARGQWIEKQFGECKTSVIITFHPAFLMRQPAQKKMAWIDLKMIRDKKAELKI